MSEALFTGLKVLDVGTWIAGPVAATILADFGADVTKVEIPGAGDQYRILSSLPGYPDAETNYMWDLDGRNKRSLSLNLKSAQGIEILHKLVAACDVYITNQPFPMRDSLHLNYEDLRDLNPKMIYASLTAYGEHGPDRNREGFDLVAYWARTGLMDLVRDPHALPSQALPGMGDHPSAVSLYAAIVTALLKREKTGEGGMVHTSLMANGLWSASCIAQAGIAGGDYEAFRARRQVRRFPGSVYETADQRYFLFTMIRTPAEFTIFLASLGLADLEKDERFGSPEMRFMNSDSLSDTIAERVSQKTAAQWQEIFGLHGVPAVLAGRVEEMADDPQVRINNMTLTPVDDRVGSKAVINHPVGVDGAGAIGPTKAPDVGEHNQEILLSLGYDLDTIKGFGDAGII